LYDAWTYHRIRFDDPAVLAAGAMLDQIISGDGYLYSDRRAIDNLTYLTYVPARMLEDPPQCWLYPGASYTPSVLPEGTDLGTDVGVFVLPPVSSGDAVPVAGGGDLLTATVDRPEVRVFIEHVMSPEWGELWAAPASSMFLSPNLHFDVMSYGVDASGPERDIRRLMGYVTQTAIAEDGWRLDASDLMPPEVGAVSNSGRGAFLQAMLDYVDDRRTLPDALADVEQVWAELEAGGS
jgi:alpha-glucoside transport system substrate-binding protein